MLFVKNEYIILCYIMYIYLSISISKSKSVSYQIKKYIIHTNIYIII